MQLGDNENIARRVIMHDVLLYADDSADYMPEEITFALGGRFVQIRTAAELKPYLDASALADGDQREAALRALVGTWP